MNCEWCETAFEPRRNGGSVQRFCSKDCRLDFYTACRNWGARQYENGRVSVTALRESLGQRARSLKADLAPVCAPAASEGRKRPDGPLRPGMRVTG